MKNLIKLFSIVFVFGAIFMSCEGPAGPAGADGTDGTDGVDGNVSCLVCHTQANMDAVYAEYAQSIHNVSTIMYTGQTVYQYASTGSGREECSGCHSNEGFISRVRVGSLEGLPTVEAPSRISCETCHGNHTSLEEGIEAPLRKEDAVTAVVGGGLTFNFDGPSNLCANCHQARTTYADMEAIDSLNGVAVGAGNVAINSSHAGPHHGPQANTLTGNGGYGNSVTATHTTLGCVGCHMAESTDAAEGGHTFNPALEKCQECHTDATSFDVNGKQTDFDTRMNAIADALVVEGALSGNSTDGYSTVPGIYPQAVFEAWWNYMVCYEDHSHGVHNPGYFNTLLTQAEAKLGI